MITEPSIIRKVLKYFVEYFTDTAMSFLHFSFPTNYNWRWKWQMVFGKYEKETVDFFKKNAKPNMVVLDIGAHIGYFTRLVSKFVGSDGKIYAFEPDEENFRLLKKNTAHLKNVKAFKLAITDKKEIRDFYLSQSRTGNHSLIAGVVPNQIKITVIASDLDSILKQEGEKKVNFIKMDIEGGEPFAIEGMKNILAQNKNIALVSEFAPAWLQKAGVQPLEYLEKLRALGFEILAVFDGKFKLFKPQDEVEMKKIMPSYFINIYCRRS